MKRETEIKIYLIYIIIIKGARIILHLLILTLLKSYCIILLFRGGNGNR